jgi:hypothetical protein
LDKVAPKESKEQQPTISGLKILSSLPKVELDPNLRSKRHPTAVKNNLLDSKFMGLLSRLPT